ncbi:hypothetical protein EV421DRAFT_1743921 [Armillaria borealis]|uniref:Uncharacterized protein n=1 Tax=Armillaria borealis TaxID=47425 RepID=A0AA39IU57_9AGAR|nr:hypothetical protein EV421DRAFT_1743921 [Armillaria borealis]
MAWHFEGKAVAEVGQPYQPQESYKVALESRRLPLSEQQNQHVINAWQRIPSQLDMAVNFWCSVHVDVDTVGSIQSTVIVLLLRRCKRKAEGEAHAEKKRKVAFGMVVAIEIGFEMPQVVDERARKILVGFSAPGCSQKETEGQPLNVNIQNACGGWISVGLHGLRIEYKTRYLKLQSMFHERPVGLWMPLHLRLATTHQTTPQEHKTGEDVTGDRSSWNFCSSTPELNAADEAKLQNRCSPIHPLDLPVSRYSQHRLFARICAGSPSTTCRLRSGSILSHLTAASRALGDPSIGGVKQISHICRTVFHGGLSINISALNVDKAPSTPQNVSD